MDTIVVGDLHGRSEVLHMVEPYLSTHRVVFVGDYIDSFDRTTGEQVQVLLTVLDWCDNEEYNVTALMGNHERSYVFDERCSGYSIAMAAHIVHLKERMLRTLKEYTYVGDYLVTHAGVSQALLNVLDMSLQEYLEAGKFEGVGYARGGNYPVGGLYWCDWFKEFGEIPNQPQILGHSGYRPSGYKKGIISKGNSFNIDCFEHCYEVLVVSESGAETLKLEAT